MNLLETHLRCSRRCGPWVPLFLEENLEYARRLMRAGISTELHVYPGAYHGFPLVAGAWMSQALQRDQLAALKRAFHRDMEKEKKRMNN